MSKTIRDIQRRVGRLCDWYLANKPEIVNVFIFPADWKALHAMKHNAMVCGFMFVNDSVYYRGLRVLQANPSDRLGVSVHEGASNAHP